MGDDARLAALEARAAISDLVHVYAQHVRLGQGSECGKLFTDDAVFEVRQAAALGAPSFTTRSKAMGREAIAAYVAKSAAPGVQVCPLISNLLVEVNGAEAVSTCVMRTILLGGGEGVLGEYRDTFRKDAEWRFTSRTFTIVRVS